MREIDDWIKFYREKEWSIIPLTYPTGGFNDGKRPAINQWLTYIEKRPSDILIGHWWSESKPLLNLGVITGRVSNLAAIDVDNETAYNSLTQSNSRFVDTYTVKTGKGFHIYFVPNEHRRTCTFSLDGSVHHLKGEGSYIVAPPSRHMNGKQYVVHMAKDVACWNIDEVKEWIANANGVFTAHQNKDTRPVTWASELCEPVPEGQRNTIAAQLCGLLIRRFMYDEGFVLGMMKAWNHTYCDPPLSEGELTTLVEGEFRRYGPRD